MGRPSIPLYCVSDSCKDHGVRRDDTTTYPPLALGMMLARVRADEELRQRYHLVPTMISTEDELRASYREHGPGVLLYSDYIRTIRKNLELSALAKRLDARNLNLHGGPSVPKYHEANEAFHAAHPHVDLGVRGEGENTIVELLGQISGAEGELDPEALAGVAGLTFRRRGGEGVVRTAERARQRDLDQLPSPYLMGIFDGFHGTPESWTAAIIETNRGCPYGCTFCDWGSATLAKVQSFSMERVAREIAWISEHRVSRLWIADANFGIFDRDVEIAQLICEARQRNGYPRDVIVNYAKNATRRLAEVIGLFRRAGLSAAGIISIQTHDPETLANIRRSNIRTERYEELIEIFRDEGLPVASDLLLGLPGATIETLKRDLQFFIDRQVHTVAYPVWVLPNSPMGDPEYQRRHRIELDETGYIVATSSYSREDLWRMKLLFGLYRGAVGYSILKYLLYYLQVEEGLVASEVLHLLVERLLEPDSRMPTCADVFLRRCLADDRAALLRLDEARWCDLYAEVVEFLESLLEVERTSALDAVVEAQVALMPRLGRAMPARVELAHDVGAWFGQLRRVRNLEELDPNTLRLLGDHPPATLEIEDPDGFCVGDWNPPLDLHHPPRWELSSRLSQGMAGRLTS